MDQAARREHTALSSAELIRFSPQGDCAISSLGALTHVEQLREAGRAEIASNQSRASLSVHSIRTYLQALMKEADLTT